MNDAYPLKPFRIHDDDTLCSIMRMYPLATVISGQAGAAFITLLPLLVEQRTDGQFLLSGHLDCNSEHAARLVAGAPVSFQFVGPDSYASPDLYPESHLPGWLYLSVSGDGEVSRLLDERELRNLLLDSTEVFGSSDQKFSLQEHEARVGPLLSFISGFEIRVKRVRGIAKLAQDKGPLHAGIAAYYLASQDNSGSLELFRRILNEVP